MVKRAVRKDGTYQKQLLVIVIVELSHMHMSSSAHYTATRIVAHERKWIEIDICN